MCLRYAFSIADFKLLSARFRLKTLSAELKPRYNISPTQRVPVIFNDSPSTLSESVWGLPARWHDASGAGHLLFNARAETIDHKPSFRKDFEERRCLMLSDGFYEWKQPEKRPFRIGLKDGSVFAFAAIFAETEKGRACCMITTSSNGLVSKIHDRMPVIQPAGHDSEWLTMDPEAAKRTLQPYPADQMAMFEVSKKVNSSKFDTPDLIEPKTGKGTLLEWTD